MAAGQNSTKIEEETTDPILCIKKCGFFGSRERMNMCSKCYRDHVAAMEKQAVLATAKANANANDDGDNNHNNNDNSAAEETTVGKKRKRRCFSCEKRVGLTAFNCRCGETFCSLHRLPEQHDCSYDYKTPGREAIAKANPVVKRSKIEKI